MSISFYAKRLDFQGEVKERVVVNIKERQPDEILFLSGIYPDGTGTNLKNPSVNRNVQTAADVLQKHIICGLEATVQKPLKLVNAPYVGVYPRACKILHFRRTSFSHCEGANDINIPFWNIGGLRHFSIYHNSKREIKEWIEDHPNGTVMTYALTLRNVYRLLYAKRVSSTVKTCMIVPDLPLYMRMSAGWAYRLMKQLENKWICRNLQKIDSYVLLTEHMNEMIGAENYCVVEGISTCDFPERNEDDSYRIVLYTGTVDRKYGILELLEAFHRIKATDVRLYICGIGDGVPLIEEMARKDSRIRYFGQVSREEILSYQSQAALLVNPRPNTEIFTKYSFPSKNLEYMSSGTPLVAYKLDGIPDEYDPYIRYVEENTVESLQDAMEQVLNYSRQERQQNGENARKFVRKYKNATVQAKKILELLRNI